MPVGTLNLKTLRGYAIGVGFFAVAFVVRGLAGPWFQVHYPYFTYFFAVVATAYFAGLWPALAVSAISAAAATATYSPPNFLTLAQMPSSPIGGIMFFLATAGVGAAIATLRLARDRLEAERKRYADLAESRDLLYRELQHRVSNNIQVVAGLLRVQAATASPSGRKALSEASERIAVIAKIQRELHNQTGAPTPFRYFAQDLLSDAVTAAGAEGITVRVDGGDEPLHPNQATAVSLVLLECFNNALEHGYGGTPGGVVRVSLERQANQWLLTVGDDGRGPREDLDAERGDSLGLKIVRAMAAQLHGEFSIAPGSPGAICRLSFPALD